MTYTVKHQVKRTRVNAIIKCVCNPLSPLIQRPAETLRCVVCDLCWRMVGRPKDSTRETRRRFRNGGEIYYLQHISYLVYQAHTLQLTHGISDNRTHENLRVTPRYKQHHSKQVIIYRTRLQRCLAAWHIHYLTSTPSLSDGVPAIRSTNKN